MKTTTQVTRVAGSGALLALSLSLSGCFSCASGGLCLPSFFQQPSVAPDENQFSKKTTYLVKAHRPSPNYSLRYHRSEKDGTIPDYLRREILPKVEATAPPRGPRYFPRIRRVGKASYYPAFLNGHPTRSGERLDNTELTAAHGSLPFDAQVKVINLDTKEEVVVRINDRMPKHPEHIIELSQAAAGQIGLTKNDLTMVRLEVLPE